MQASTERWGQFFGDVAHTAGTRYTTFVCSRPSIGGGQPRTGLHVLLPHVPGALFATVSSRNYRQMDC